MARSPFIGNVNPNGSQTLLVAACDVSTCYPDQIFPHKYWPVENTGRNVEIEHRLAHHRLKRGKESGMGMQDSLATTEVVESTSEKEFVGSNGKDFVIVVRLGF